MSAEQLTRLAEPAAPAAGYFTATDPADAALASGKLDAEKLVANLARENEAPPLGGELTGNTTHLVVEPEVA
jgi:hypothetical protein